MTIEFEEEYEELKNRIKASPGNGDVNAGLGLLAIALAIWKK